MKKKPLTSIFSVLLGGVLLLGGCGGFITGQQMTHRIAPEDLKARLESGDAFLVVDVRSVNAFKKLRIAGAISVPLKEIGSQLDKFPRDHEIVFYCT